MKDYPYVQADDTPAIDAEANEWGASQQELIDAEMQLPPGEHCESCKTYIYCVDLFHCFPESTRCDWSPSRYKPKSRKL